MADFAAVLKKTLEQMGETTPEARGKVYDKARDTVRRQIDSMEKTPPQAAIDRQFEKLEEAINSVEVEFAPDEVVLEVDDIVDEIVDEAPAEEGVVPVEDAVEPDEDIDPEIAREAEAEGEGESEPTFDDDVESSPMPTPDEVVAEVTTVSPEEVAQFADDSTDSDSPTDPLADFINEHSNVSEDEASIDAAAEDLKSVAGVEDDDVLGDITPEREPEAVLANEPVTGIEEDNGGGSGRFIKILVVLGILGGGGYYAYANQETVKTWWQGVTGETATMESGENSSENAGTDASEGETAGDLPVRTVTTTTVEGGDTAQSSEAATNEAEPPAPVETANAGSEDAQPKFTQRLTEDGTEVDEGPAQVASTSTEVAEGSSIAEQTTGTQETAEEETAQEETPPEEEVAVVVPEEPAAADTATGTPVGQRAIFYEERTGSQEGTALAGATIWSVANESPGGDLPVEPAIRAETSIPELGIEMEMTIRRNGDSTFPASHIVELFFTVPETFEGRGIADVQRVTFKSVEQDPGNALIAVPAPIDENIFMIALTDATTAVDTNVSLMKREKWIDIPMQYTSGRRALITLEKGIPGDRVFNEVFEAWEAAPIN